MGLNGLGKPHLVVLTVKHGVVLPNEHIAQNPQWPSRRRDIQSHESTQTDLSTSLALLHTHTRNLIYQEENRSHYSLAVIACGLMLGKTT